VQAWQTQLGQTQLGQTQLGQVQLRHAESAAVVAAFIAAVATSVDWSMAAWLTGSCTARSFATITTFSRCCTCRLAGSCTARSFATVTAFSRCMAGWLAWSHAGRLDAASAALVGLEQTEQTGLGAVGDSEDHQSSCKCERSHRKFSYTSFLLRELDRSH